MVRFLVSLLVLTVLFFISLYAGIFKVPSFGSEIILYSALTTAVVFYLLKSRVSTDAMLFTQAYLLSIVLKMLAGCAFILIVILLDRRGATANAILFIIAYFLFTVLEVVFLYHSASNGRR